MDLILIAGGTLVYLLIGASFLTMVLWAVEKVQKGYHDEAIEQSEEATGYSATLIRRLMYGITVVFWPAWLAYAVYCIFTKKEA